MDLLIVESPTKAKTLGRFLPSKQYKVLPTVGHIRDLPKSKLGVDVEHDFEPQWEWSTGKREVLSDLKKYAVTAKRIFLATDPDREGEAISAHVFEMLQETKNLKLSEKEVRRVTFHEITQRAVEDAIAQAHTVDEHLVSAQTARRVVDRLVGYSLSPVLWRKIRRGLSAGRVQSVAVRLIVEKEREREAFVPVESWDIQACLEVGHIVEPWIPDQTFTQGFWAKLTRKNGKKYEIGEEHEAMEVQGHLSGAEYRVDSVTTKPSVTKAPPPFTTSTLQQNAGQKLGFGAKRTMSVAQALYEQGLITYHRTDATNLSVEAIAAVREFVTHTYGATYLPDKPQIYVTKSKVAQEAHEAIRPTDVFKTPEESGLSGGELSLYKLIWQRFVSCQMKPALFDKTDILIKAATDIAVFGLEVSGKVRTFDGWLRVSGKMRENDEIPQVQEGMDLRLLQLGTRQWFTEPPARYSEATLIKALEQLGIGRPSTYAATISTIQDRRYIEKDEGRLKPTAIGLATNDFLVQSFPNELDYQFTARMEDDLDAIANGHKQWQKVVKEFYAPFIDHIEKAGGAARVSVPTESTGETCPVCKEGDVVIRTGRYGKFLSCSRFPECKYTGRLEDKLGVKCPDCKTGDVVAKRTKKGRKFFGCNRYPECKWASWDAPAVAANP